LDLLKHATIMNFSYYFKEVFGGKLGSFRNTDFLLLLREAGGAIVN
jgi:hypothetical protein